MKRASIRRMPAAAVLILASGIAVCGSDAPLPATARLGLAPGRVAAAGARATPIVLPTTSQVIKAVADGVKVVRYPPQPPHIAPWRDGCSSPYEATASPLCVYGDPHGTRLMVVYGDSHAAMWLPPLDALGKFKHWKVVQITKARCQVADFPSWLPQEQRPYTECSAFRSWALARIRQLHPDVVLLSSTWRDDIMAVVGHPTTQGMEAAWDAGLASMITRITPWTGRIIVVGDFAYNPEGGLDCLAIHTSDVRPCDAARKDAVFDAHNQLERSVAARYRVLYVDTVPWFCTTTVCPAIVDGLATHSNVDHVEPHYALWLADALGVAAGLLPSTSA